ncbi:MAG: ubiquinone/menaquinone biosynthesis C-methylase UbiE [Granulosicoccus sp.]|jgi:ubiquinone/menaquinone biosynthesis C-methylase UbiE
MTSSYKGERSMDFSARIQYHLGELEVASDPSSPYHIQPKFDDTDQAILDIGCGIGQTLIASKLEDRQLVVGMDIEMEPLVYGSKNYESIQYMNGNAESLPFAACSFDKIISRVALPYTFIPHSVAELSRVLKPGGSIWVTLHPVSKTMQQLAASTKSLDIKGMIFRSYTIMNGVAFHVAGKLYRWPRDNLMESFQTRYAMTRCLKENGFENIEFENNRYFKCTATKKR